jgi:hypothetical protein
MARAHTIYVVLHPAPAEMDDHLKAAFTVKHELKTWWKNCINPYKEEFEVWRIRDGGRRIRDMDKSIIPISEL